MPFSTNRYCIRRSPLRYPAQPIGRRSNHSRIHDLSARWSRHDHLVLTRTRLISISDTDFLPKRTPLTKPYSLEVERLYCPLKMDHHHGDMDMGECNMNVSISPAPLASVSRIRHRSTTAVNVKSHCNNAQK